MLAAVTPDNDKTDTTELTTTDSVTSFSSSASIVNEVSMDTVSEVVGGKEIEGEAVGDGIGDEVGTGTGA